MSQIVTERWPALYDYPTAVPSRPVRLPAGTRPRTAGLEMPPSLETGPVGMPFDFCLHARRLCADVVTRCPELAHIDTTRVLFAVTQARSGTRRGLQARTTPLRFRAGAKFRRRGGVVYRVQRYRVGGREMLYLMTFCLPRFLDQGYDEKFITLFHELYHISPGCEGDLRRLHGRCALHSTSKRAYDAHMAGLARAYLATRPATALYDWLRLDFAQLAHRHGRVEGAFVPRPRMLPVSGTLEELADV
jgi:hypothetical protein